MKTIIKQLGVAVAVVAASSAYAVPTAWLTINDGSNPIITVLDNGAGDINPTEGIIDWNGTVGVWTVNLDSGTSKPILGSATVPHMDLAFKAISGGGAGILTLTFSDVGFNFTGGITDRWGGTTAGEVLNQVLENGQVIATLGPSGPGAFSGNTGGAVNLNDLTDSLSLVVQITHTRMGITTGNKEVTSVPDGGSSLLLLGLGLLGLAGIRRKA